LVQEQQEEWAKQIEDEASPAILREILPVAMHFVEAIRKGMTSQILVL
jgi:hypothetical protein